MIIGAEIIGQPYSGEYKEVIYDIPCIHWKSEYWGWVRFTNQDYSEWCGDFRGKILGVEMSKRFNSILILTTDCLFVLDKTTGELIDNNVRPEYEQLTLSPLEEYILVSYGEILIIKDSTNDLVKVNIPSNVYSVKFLEWQGHNLILKFEDCNGIDMYSNVSLDSKTYEIVLNNT
ncbi:hypothetical protein [Clostridium sp. D53t1_180928_C8]|uniref:hypothetical protein n=1 Tax=Clostridium sp. D53t1_180928_C8 TaxID=2787101 RepID=UPI0018ABDDD2|nr:hypothetical protein [Clostridium sp. D53t1_180928_C8]